MSFIRGKIEHKRELRPKEMWSGKRVDLTEPYIETTLGELMDKMNEDERAIEEAAGEECFDYNACFTGDCLHSSIQECGSHFFKAGVAWARANPKKEEPAEE